jgi:hypothetical protein
MSPLLLDLNSSSDKPLASFDGDGRTTGRTEEADTIDAELTALVSAWHGLPLPIRAAIRALIGTV